MELKLVVIVKILQKGLHASWNWSQWSSLKFYQKCPTFHGIEASGHHQNSTKSASRFMELKLVVIAKILQKVLHASWNWS